MVKWATLCKGAGFNKLDRTIKHSVHTYTVFLAKRPLNIWSYTVHIYDSGQPYIMVHIMVYKYGVYLHGVFGREITEYTDICSVCIYTFC